MTTSRLGAQCIGWAGFLLFGAGIFGLIRLVATLSRGGGFDDAAMPGGDLRVAINVENRSVNGYYRCRSPGAVVFTPSWDSTQAWEFVCKDRAWDYEIQVPARESSEANITLRGRLLLPPRAPLGRASGLLHGTVSAPSAADRYHFANYSQSLAVPLAFDVVSPEALSHRRRALFVPLVLWVTIGFLGGGVLLWAGIRLEARGSAA